MTGHGAKYDRKKEEAILALLKHPTLAAAAKAVGIGTTTLGRWMREEDFREAYRAAKQEATAFALGQLQQGMVEAVATLREIVDPETDEFSNVRVSAAKALLSLGLKAVEVDDLAARVARLERERGGAPSGSGQSPEAASQG